MQYMFHHTSGEMGEKARLNYNRNIKMINKLDALHIVVALNCIFKNKNKTKKKKEQEKKMHTHKKETSCTLVGSQAPGGPVCLCYT